MSRTLTRTWPLLVLIGLVGFSFLVVRSGVSLQTLPALGGVRGDTYELTIEVDDVLNLPDHAHVRLGGADVGTVHEIEADNYHAVLTVAIKEGVELPVGTTAELRQATPLGDLFVALTPPEGGAKKLLAQGDTIGLKSTRSAPQVEDLLAAASVVVNGGAIADLSTIVREMNAMLRGNESHIGGVTSSIGVLTNILNDRAADIDAQLVDLNTATRLFRENKELIRRGLVDFTPAIEVAADERAAIMRLAHKLLRLGLPIRKLIATSSGELIASIDGVTEVLLGLARIGDKLGPTLRDMLALADVADFSTQGEQLSGVAYVGISPALIQSIIEILTSGGPE